MFIIAYNQCWWVKSQAIHVKYLISKQQHKFIPMNTVLSPPLFRHHTSHPPPAAHIYCHFRKLYIEGDRKKREQKLVNGFKVGFLIIKFIHAQYGQF